MDGSTWNQRARVGRASPCPVAKSNRLFWWNVGGLSDTGRQDQVLHQLDIHQPDVAALSEVQFADETEFGLKVNTERLDNMTRPKYDLSGSVLPPPPPWWVRAPRAPRIGWEVGGSNMLFWGTSSSCLCFRGHCWRCLWPSGAFGWPKARRQLSFFNDLVAILVPSLLCVT